MTPTTSLSAARAESGCHARSAPTALITPRVFRASRRFTSLKSRPSVVESVLARARGCYANAAPSATPHEAAVLQGVGDARRGGGALGCSPPPRPAPKLRKNLARPPPPRGRTRPVQRPLARQPKPR